MPALPGVQKVSEKKAGSAGQRVIVGEDSSGLRWDVDEEDDNYGLMSGLSQLLIWVK
jgi:hypothetical protein